MCVCLCVLTDERSSGIWIEPSARHVTESDDWAWTQQTSWQVSFVLIIISILSPFHSFIPVLKPSFSANPSHRSLSFLLQDWLHGFLGLFSEHIHFLLCSFSVFHFLVVGSVQEGCYQFCCLLNKGTMGVNSLPKTVTRQHHAAIWTQALLCLSPAH